MLGVLNGTLTRENTKEIIPNDDNTVLVNSFIQDFVKLMNCNNNLIDASINGYLPGISKKDEREYDDEFGKITEGDSKLNIQKLYEVWKVCVIYNISKLCNEQGETDAAKLLQLKRNIIENSEKTFGKLQLAPEAIINDDKLDTLKSSNIIDYLSTYQPI